MEAFVFPGQGSQRRGMGQGLFDKVEQFRELEQEIDGVLGYSVRLLCLEDRANQLKETQYTQPSLYIVNALHFYDAIAQGKRASRLAGHSLGEYNALLAAGAFDLITGLRLVKKRGELMAQAKNGAMAAVIGLSETKIRQILQKYKLMGLDIANVNSPTQIVVSGLSDEITRAGPMLQAAGAQHYLPLLVSAAFHSRYMIDAAKAFEEFLKPLQLAELKIPVVSNVTAGAYPATDSGASKKLLGRQITGPVLWMQTIQGLLHEGVATFTEVGPGNVLSRLVQQIKGQRH